MLWPTDGLDPVLEAGAFDVWEVAIEVAAESDAEGTVTWSSWVRLRDLPALRRIAVAAHPEESRAINESLAAAWQCAIDPFAPIRSVPFQGLGGSQDRSRSFGENEGGRSWQDARTYCFVSAGGDAWYSRTLRALPVGARVNVHIPKLGYVAVGETLAEAEPVDTARVLLDGEWVRLADRELMGSSGNEDAGDETVNDDNAEYVVPVRWTVANPKAEAYWEKGMFANQNSACKLRQEFTLDRLAQHFRLDD